MRIHRWVYDLEGWRERQSLQGGKTNPDDEVSRETYDRTGAFVMGRRMFDEGEVGWPDPPPFRAPVFILTNRAREPWVRQGGTTFTFVTDGVESALEQARAAAGEKDVLVSGGANTLGQFVEAGLLDELQIHLAPVLLGDGQVVRPCGPGAYRVRAHAGDRLAQGHASQVPRRGKRKRRSRCLTLRSVASIGGSRNQIPVA
jgi:dihydrofolate reductase